MSKYVAGIQYDGTAYSGWQIQKHSLTVQQVVENAFSKVANESVSLFCSGRTDTGVHAKEQIVHFESLAQRTDYAWRMGCNSNLPNDVRVLWCHPIDDSFHARFSAISREYRYVIYNHKAESALLTNRATWIPHSLNEQKMHAAAQVLLGEHDFSSFRASGCQSNTPFRLVQQVSVIRQRDFVLIDIKANAFLHHMVRNVVGSLIDIGREKKPELWMASLLQEKDRTKAGVTASAQGLYFMQAHYPSQYFLQKQSTRFDILF